MFKLKKNYRSDRTVVKCDFLKFSPVETSTINTPNTQVYINIPKEDSVFSFLKSYLVLNFEFIKKTDERNYANR